MATQTGWLGARVIYGHLGNWPKTDWWVDIRIDSVDRQEDKVVIKGGTKLWVVSDPGWGQAWYQAPINVEVTGAPTVQAKGDTGTQVLDGKVFQTAFTSTINVPADAESASIKIRYIDPVHNSSAWVDWSTTYTVTFEKASQPPSGTVEVTVTNPSVHCIYSTAYVEDWGFGYKTASLTARVDYSIDGVTYGYQAYSASSALSSANFTVNGVNYNPPWSRVPDDEPVTVTWVASTDLGSISGQGSCHCMRSWDAYVIESGVNGGNPVAADVFLSPETGDRPTKELRRINTI